MHVDARQQSLLSVGTLSSSDLSSNKSLTKWPQTVFYISLQSDKLLLNHKPSNSVLELDFNSGVPHLFRIIIITILKMCMSFLYAQIFEWSLW